ncbi:PGF-pre-PGF domain-containing protein [Methanofollis aquaemaris]|uniref:PGF-pre-PGF domain-containing protein n=1 Tax=Methanofollis aquaemaris TaxID=126734 RepID=A0A8A3S2N2_9EURY|nr:PGF-pre-PGF domain-containing protein [Methanofollis aquaemaris]QSZ66557.1 PGF-pre-PGF domain-containing protein [Methanofollis aquaemaris]
MILALLVFAVAGMLVAPVAAADPTTEVTIIKLAENGTEIANVSIGLDVLKAGGEDLPIQGDGTIHYWLQGIVNDADVWDASETLNLKDMGALKGTALKNLCEVVGMDEGDTVTVIPSDEYKPPTFPYESVYNPDPRQGKMVVAWECNGQEVPSYTDGMRLAFFAETPNGAGQHVFGNQDMKECLPETYWHWSDSTHPSTTGFAAKYVSRIVVQSRDPAAADWSIYLNGSTNRTLSRDEFISLAAAHPGSFQTNKYGLLEGANLSAVIALADDDDPATVNEALAAENYTITVYGKKKGVDKVSTFYSTEVTDGKKTYVLGNTFNDIEINQSTYIDRVFFPLYLQGTGVDGTQRAVEEISRIELAPPEERADEIFNDGVTLTEGTFNLDVAGEAHVVNTLTPFGALDAAATKGGFTYVVNNNQDKLVLDAIDKYQFEKKVQGWECYVNGKKLAYWGNYAEEGYPNYPLKDGDKVVFCYGPDGVTPENAVAAVLIDVAVGEDPFAGKTVIFNGGVTLTEGTYTQESAGQTYEVGNYTPFGALHAASIAGNFDYLTNVKYEKIILDAIADFQFVKHEAGWECYVNGKMLDYWDSYETEGYPNYPLHDGDEVIFYYGPDGSPEAATAVVAITVNGGTPPSPGTDWTLSLKGACDATVTKAEFEKGIACLSSHRASWTDPDTGDVWAGMPLWMLVAMVDDEEGGSHYTFNDELAAEGYSVKVISEDGYSINIPSADMAHNSGFIVSNTLNGEPLPETIGEKKKPCWPLQIKGSAADAGQLVGAIASIELVGLPGPDEGWTLKVCGAVNDTVTQAEFEESGCHGSVEYTDNKNRVWSGVPLWYFLGVSDDIESKDHWTFDDTLAATNYTVRVIASDGWSQEYGSKQVARSNGYILANLVDGQPIPSNDTSYPLKLVGDGVPKSVKAVAEIDLVDLIPGPAPEGSWNLDLKGKIDYTCTQAFFEEAASCSHHKVSWTNQKTGERWEGIALWELCGWVDDRVPHGQNGFNDLVADNGYKVIVTAKDGYSKEFLSKDIARNNNYIVANKLNGTALPNDGDKAPWPLRLVGADVAGSNSVGSIASIELTEFQKPAEVPTVRIVKFAPDGVTVLNETTVDYRWMKDHLEVHGDDQPYKFQGVTFDPNDLWNPEENKALDPPKIEDVIKGTAVRDLVDLVGGMPKGTEISFIAKDGWETKLGWKNIYDPNPRQGDAVLVWWTERQGYVPDYVEGYRLFYTPEDHVFGQWDMHESMDEAYWHYYSADGIRYPSCGGISPKWISEIRIYSVAEEPWNLSLEGAITRDISKGFFESALTCTMGANHKAEYVDAQGNRWGGMPLYFLCGWVDDANEHSGKAFDRELALKGYTIDIVGRDGSVKTLSSRDIIDSRDYIIANTLDGKVLNEKGVQWPLVLVGANVTSEMQVDGVERIRLNLDTEFTDLGPVKKGEAVNMTVNNSPVFRINVTVGKDVPDFVLSVGSADLPPEVKAPVERLYQTLQISAFGTASDDIDGAEIRFSVPLTWLSAQGLAPADVVLYRYHGDAWQQLPTTHLENRDGAAYYTATTPGFSFFAVGGVATPKPISGGSSSSGSSSAVSAFAGSLQAGEKKTFLVGETAISKITLGAYDQVSDLLVTVKKASLPGDAQTPEGQVYELEEITLYRADPAALEGVTIEFAVPSGWLASQGVGTGDIAMLRYVDGAWKHLETEFLGEEGGKALYHAESPGFSYFAIATVKGGSAGPEVTHPSVEAPVETPTEPATQTTETIETIETTVPVTTPKKTPVFWGLSLIALGALLILRRK